MDLSKKVEQFIGRHQLASKGDTVIIGVSGGPDSVCLLDLLNHLKYKYGYHLIVAHFNHQLHSQADHHEYFVKKLAAIYHLPFYSAPWQRKKSNALVNEEAARKARYAFLEKTAKKVRSRIIALAHHEDDLAETVLMRIIRGSGLEGLRSILPKREVNQFIYIRPILNITREEIICYIRKQKLKYVQDPTNKDPKYLRNKIRLQLIPYLEKGFNRNVKSVLANLAQTSSLDYAYLEKEAQRLYAKLVKRNGKVDKISFSFEVLKKHPAMQRQLLRLAYSALKGDKNKLTYQHTGELENLLNAASAIMYLPNGIRVIKKEQRISFYK